MSQDAVSVIVTSYEDERIRRTLASLEEQTREPVEVLIADGSRDAAFLGELEGIVDDHGARLVHEHGASVARARNLALDQAKGAIVAFLDTDQQAPASWLATLVAPIIEGVADWTGGPTRPEAELDVMELKEERLYAAAREDPTRIPMGNSAWRREIFETVGGFDERLSMGGEDWDLALRASKEGYKGQLVEDAWVHHDLTSIDSYVTLAKKQFRYNVGGAMAYLKNKRFTTRVKTRQPTVGRHWFDAIEPLLKAAALPIAWWRLRRMNTDDA